MTIVQKRELFESTPTLELGIHEGQWILISQDLGRGMRILEKEIFKIQASTQGPTSPTSDTTDFTGVVEDGKFRNNISFSQQEGQPDVVFDIAFPNVFLGYKGCWASLDLQWHFDPENSIVRTDGWQWDVDVSSLFERGMKLTTKLWRVSEDAAGARQFITGIIKGYKMRITIRSSLDTQMLTEALTALVTFPLRCVVYRNSARAIDYVTLSESAGSTSVISSTELKTTETVEPGDGFVFVG